MKFQYVRDPHPCILVSEIVEPMDYAAMRFPDHLVAKGAGWGITGDDAAYDVVLKDDRWRRLLTELRSEQFVKTVLATFAEDMLTAGCLVDADKARLIDFVESREQKDLSTLAEPGDPNELFTRVDFQSKGLGAYREFVHLDWARRLIGGILFFSDGAEEGLEGGELALYRDRDFRNDRWCHDPELTAMFPPRHNTGVIFLNSNSGFHGPRAITKLDGRRRWLYYTISSIVDVWPTTPAPSGSRTVLTTS